MKHRTRRAVIVALAVLVLTAGAGCRWIRQFGRSDTDGQPVNTGKGKEILEPLHLPRAADEVRMEAAE